MYPDVFAIRQIHRGKWFGRQDHFTRTVNDGKEIVDICRRQYLLEVLRDVQIFSLYAVAMLQIDDGSIRIFYGAVGVFFEQSGQADGFASRTVEFGLFVLVQLPQCCCPYASDQ